MEHFDYSKVYALLNKEIQKGYIIHGTNSNFNTFDPSKIQGGFRAKEGYGFYFTDTAYKAMEYGQIYKKVRKDDFNFLDGRAPIHLEMFDNPFLVEYYRIQTLMDNSTNSRDYYYYENELNRIKDEMKGFGNIFDIVLDTIKKYNLKTIGAIEYNIEYPEKNIPKLIEVYKYYGFDGYHCDNVYTIFNFDKLNNLVEDVEIAETMSEEKKKARQGIIPYESDTFEIGFEGNQANAYAHVINESEKCKDMLSPFLKSIAEFMQTEGLNVSPFPKIELKWDEQEDLPILSKTAYYAPREMKIVLFCKDRHPKDVLRSYAHELIHHMQNLSGADMGFTAEDNVKDNDRLEQLESEAYLKGNIYFRKWTEHLKQKKNNLNENISLEDIDFSSFKVQNELNPDFWKNKRLDSRIRLKLLDIADDFTDFLNVDWVKPEDITMTGSLANYNWSDYSDIDLHIIIDYKKVDNRTEFVAEYFKSKKEIWNNEHQNLTIFGFPVEIYVQDKNEPHASSGVYSLERDRWIKEPEKLKNPKKTTLNKAGKNAAKWMNKIDNLMSRYYPDKTETEKESILDDLDDIFDEIKDNRRDAFERGEDEMNPDNLTFKVLRRNGYLDKIWDKKTEIYDELNSLNESMENSNTLIIYHRVDWDGYTSGAVALQAYPNATLLGWNYGDALPDVSMYDTVILVDLTLSDKNNYTWMYENADKLIWIDHHGNAISKVQLNGLEGIQKEGIGASVLAWNYFFPGQEIPAHIALIGTYDVFRKDGKYAEWSDAWSYQLALNQLGPAKNTEQSNALLQKAIQFINEPIQKTIQRIKIGEQLESNRATKENEMFNDAKFVKRNGIVICKLIADGQPAMLIKTNSDNHTADLFAIRSTLPLKTDNTQYKVSLRVPEKSKVDASKIARQFGGNGHEKAAGCIMSAEDFDNL